MKHRLAFIVMAITLLLSGCASPPQQAVDFDKATYWTKPAKVGVAMTALPKVDTQFPGADCLLCIIAASAANSTLTDHTRKLPYEDLPALKENIAKRLKKKGVEAVVIQEEVKINDLPDYGTSGVNVAKKDFSSFQQKYQIDKLVVINLTSLGMQRTYAAYFPTSDPKALLVGSGFMVNLKNNTYEWYKPMLIMKSASGAWDEPPSYPGLSNAYFQVVEAGKDSLLKPFD